MSTQPPRPGDLARAAAQSASPDPTLHIREKYQAAIERVWRRPDNCPICDSSAWNVGELVDVPLRGMSVSTSLAAAASGLMPKVYVYVPVTCVYCGYTLFFHAGVLDVRETEEVKA